MHYFIKRIIMIIIFISREWYLFFMIENIKFSLSLKEFLRSIPIYRLDIWIRFDA